MTGPSRLIALPQVGTLAEAGVGGFGDYSWFGLFAPAGTPPEIVRKISDSVNRVQSDPALANNSQMTCWPHQPSQRPRSSQRFFRRALTHGHPSSRLQASPLINNKFAQIVKQYTSRFGVS